MGRDPEKTRERAERADIPIAATSLDDALQRANPDLVVVATPPHSHADLVIEAVSRGKHVLCEKPFARNLTQARAMLSAAQAQGIVHYMGTEHRWDTGQALLTQAIRSGLIGDARMITLILQVPLLYDAATEVPHWWGDCDQGGGWLGAYGSHQIDFLNLAFAGISGLSASLETLSDHDWSADDSFSMHFETHCGAHGIMQSSVATLGAPLIQTRVMGSAGALEMTGDQVFIIDGHGRRELKPAEDLINAPPIPADAVLMNTAYDRLHAGGSDLSPFTKLYQTMRADLNEQARPYQIEPGTFADGVAMQRVLDAARLSARERCWVSCSD